MRSRSSLAIHLPKEEDELYHKTKVEAMMTAEEEFWRDNPDEYDKYLKYEIEEVLQKPSNIHKIFNKADVIKPLLLILFLQCGVFVWIMYVGFEH